MNSSTIPAPLARFLDYCDARQPEAEAHVLAARTEFVRAWHNLAATFTGRSWA